MLAEAIRSQPARQVEARLAGGDHIEHEGARDAAEHLRDDVGANLAERMPATGPEADRHRRIEMTAGNVADRVGHRQHGQAERERYAGEADADLRKGRRQHGTAATTEHEPERADEFGCEFLRHGHVRFPSDVC